MDVMTVEILDVDSAELPKYNLKGVDFLDSKKSHKKS